jgi:uncharacterized protein (DUF1684 family)
MKSSKIIIILAVVIVAIIVAYSMSTGFVDKGYSEQIIKERKERDDYMKQDNESPFAGKVELFAGLKYFPPNPVFRIVADLEPIKERKMVLLKTNDGKEQRYLEYAYASFRLADKLNKLLVLEVADSGPFRGTLFLAFADETSAFETYGAGRYLDVEKTPGATSITLDFNKAYNPYCAYSDSFSCPLPPRENILAVAIRAGEMNYEEAHQD